MKNPRGSTQQRRLLMPAGCYAPPSFERAATHSPNLNHNANPDPRERRPNGTNHQTCPLTSANPRPHTAWMMLLATAIQLREEITRVATIMLEACCFLRWGSTRFGPNDLHNQYAYAAITPKRTQESTAGRLSPRSPANQSAAAAAHTRMNKKTPNPKILVLRSWIGSFRAGCCESLGGLTGFPCTRFKGCVPPVSQGP